MAILSTKQVLSEMNSLPPWDGGEISERYRELAQLAMRPARREDPDEVVKLANDGDFSGIVVTCATQWRDQGIVEISNGVSGVIAVIQSVDIMNNTLWLEAGNMGIEDGMAVRPVCH